MSPLRRRPARDLLAIARRRVWLATRVFVVLAAAVIAVVFLYPATFRSETVVELPTAADARRAVSKLGDRATLETLAREFRFTADLLAQPNGLERAVDLTLRSSIHVEPIADETLKVSFDANDPETAKQVTERLAQLVLAAAETPAPTAASIGARFLDAELAQADTLLATQQERLDAYHERHPNEETAHLEQASRSLQIAQAESQALAVAIARDRERLQARAQGVVPPSVAEPKPTPAPPDPLVAELAAAKATLTDLLARLTPVHPDVTRQQDEIHELESRLAARVSASASAASTSTSVVRQPLVDEEATALSQRIVGNEAQRRRVLQTIASLRVTLDAAPEAQAELIALTRDYESLQRLRADLSAKAEAMAATAASKIRVARILSPARAPGRPHSPNRRQALAFGLAAALIAAVAAAAAQEARDTRVHDQDDLRSLSDVPVLGVVSEVLTLEQTAAGRAPAFFRALLAPMLGVGLVLAWWWAQ